MTSEWTYGPVEKRGGCWGFFKTHIPTGRQRFVAGNWGTKKEATAALKTECDTTTTTESSV